ncbi:hypothetical protein OAP63_06075 [Vibrio sp.]|nr:hypothetical protein [Vibrio sp.]
MLTGCYFDQGKSRLEALLAKTIEVSKEGWKIDAIKEQASRYMVIVTMGDTATSLYDLKTRIVKKESDSAKSLSRNINAINEEFKVSLEYMCESVIHSSSERGTHKEIKPFELVLRKEKGDKRLTSYLCEPMSF